MPNYTRLPCTSSSDFNKLVLSRQHERNSTRRHCYRFERSRAGVAMSEPSFADVVEEVKELKRGFDAWASLPSTRRSGTPALELVEAPLRAFFAKATSKGVIAGKGDRPAEDHRYSSDMDIVLDFETAAWVARFRMEVQNTPVLAHLDVCARSDWDSNKLAGDLERLQRTTDEAKTSGLKTWTGLVAVGVGFRGRSSDVMELVHSFHHSRDVSEWTSTNVGDTWPLVDAIVLPGMLLKKHDLFELPERSAKRWPVLYPFAVTGHAGLEDLWPLVSARAFLASYLRKAVSGESWEAPAWRDDEEPIVMGGAHVNGLWPTDWRVIALADEVPLELYHWTGVEQRPWQDYVRHDDVRCSSDCAYSLLPRPSFSMTEERRAQIIRILRQDLRWSTLLQDSGSRLVAELEFPESLADEFERIVESARRLGFDAEAHHRVVKAKGAEPKRSICISSSSAIIASRFAELRQVLRQNFGRAVHLDPHLVADALHHWASQRGCNYDPAEVIAKPIGSAVVFAFVERETRQPTVVVVLGDVVEEIEDSQVMDTLFERDD
jgi:hypothetical protein